MDTSTAPATPDSTLYRVGHRVFVIGLILKGLNAAAELVGGALLLLLPFVTVQQIVHVIPLNIFREGLTEKLVDFAAWYFLSHGALKGVVIACLMWGKTWAYPLGIVIFVGFGIYQTASHRLAACQTQPGFRFGRQSQRCPFRLPVGFLPLRVGGCQIA